MASGQHIIFTGQTRGTKDNSGLSAAMDTSVCRPPPSKLLVCIVCSETISVSACACPSHRLSLSPVSLSAGLHAARPQHKWSIKHQWQPSCVKTALNDRKTRNTVCRECLILAALPSLGSVSLAMTWLVSIRGSRHVNAIREVSLLSFSSRKASDAVFSSTALKLSYMKTISHSEVHEF